MTFYRILNRRLILGGSGAVFFMMKYSSSSATFTCWLTAFIKPGRVIMRINNIQALLTKTEQIFVHLLSKVIYLTINHYFFPKITSIAKLKHIFAIYYFYIEFFTNLSLAIFLITSLFFPQPFVSLRKFIFLTIPKHYFFDLVFWSRNLTMQLTFR